MSRRYMKKVFGNDVLASKNVDNESDVENPVIENVKSKTFNVFDMLNENSENGENDNDVEELSAEEESCSVDIKRKKRKKRRRKVDNNGVERNETEEEDNDEKENKEEMDEIEKIVREVNKMLGEPVPSCSFENPNGSQWATRCKEDILMVQYKHLNPFNELKRIFGSETVRAEDRRNRNRGRPLKKTSLVLPKKTWAPVDKSEVFMTLDNSMPCSEGVQYFMFDHSPFYRQMQLKFIEAVESLNSDNVADVLHGQLYHVDALLQVAELCKFGENLPFAVELTERALYCLECAFHPLFDVTSARCRLNYRRQQNRAFFITVFKHLGMVAGRACYRTSLEFCKLLLSLDPDGDPLAAVLCIDFYALRARKYKWFIAFCNLWESSRNLSQLPNIAYSLALANFHMGDRAAADELLQNALIMFPGVLVPLLEKCSIQTDDRVTGHEFFYRKATTTTWPALEKLQTLYIARCFHLWKEADILPWLKECVHAVLERVDSKDQYVKFCEVKRSKRYQGKLPRNILRHIILSDIKDVTVNIPEVQQEGLVLSYDPLPPLDSIDIYKTPLANKRSVSTSSNILSLFVSSLFINPDGEAPGAREGPHLFHENGDPA